VEEELISATEAAVENSAFDAALQALLQRSLRCFLQDVSNTYVL